MSSSRYDGGSSFVVASGAVNPTLLSVPHHDDAPAAEIERDSHVLKQIHV